MPNYTNPIGLWLPLVTPFREDAIDESSLKRLIGYYVKKEISGFILAATTGEGQTISFDELATLVRVCANELKELNAPQDIYVGISGSDPVKVVADIHQTKHWPVDGYLISGPNYLRPSQAGVLAYFMQIAECTEKPIIIYNIPYRSGVNIENDTMLTLTNIPNVVGVKDCCGSAEQSYELIRSAPDNFSVLTGEDPFFYNAMANGAQGAILTGAHVMVDEHLRILRSLENNNHSDALKAWNSVAHIPRLLFEEPSPAPVKYWLQKKGLVNSAEVRLPFTRISNSLKSKIDLEF